MQVNTIVVGPLQTNCYVLSDTHGNAALIDLGDDADRILQYVRMHNLNVKGIWLTHGHYDHINAVPALKAVLPCPVIACEAEKSLLADGRKNLSLPFGGRPLALEADVWHKEGDVFPFGDETVTVFHTPGHTAGSCCYAVGNLLFSGDTLFENSIGRTDFPTGDPMTMRLTLQRLLALEGEYTVLPGHGPATLLSVERRENPYIR